MCSPPRDFLPRERGRTELRGATVAADPARLVRNDPTPGETVLDAPNLHSDMVPEQRISMKSFGVSPSKCSVPCLLLMSQTESTCPCGIKSSP